MVDYLVYSIQYFLFSTARYLVFAIPLFIIFWVIGKDYFLTKRIQKKIPPLLTNLREFYYSMFSIFMFSIIISMTVFLSKYSLIQIYDDISEFSILYFILSIFIGIVVHDIYFYIIHRLMHTKFLYRSVHKVHHSFTNPSPLAAFAFHPVEAILEAMAYPLITFLIPIHPFALLIIFTISTAQSTIGHLAHEIYPNNMFGRLIQWIWITPTHHNMHHQLVKCNYGLYFNILDRIFKTNHPDYENKCQSLRAAKIQDH